MGRLIFKESRIGAINGLVIGLVTALVAWIWHGSPYLGPVIGLGMLVNLFLVGLSGSSIPILMRAIGLDPPQCPSIILMTVTDVMGFLAFLGFAVLFQGYLQQSRSLPRFGPSRPGKFFKVAISEGLIRRKSFQPSGNSP